MATPASGVSLQWRNATGAECASDNITSVAAPTAANPVWVMLVKSGSLYTGYYSHDGSTWTEVGSISLNFSNSSYLAGLAVTSHASGTPCTATFDNVTLTANLSDNMALNAPVSVSSAESSVTAGANAVNANASTAWTSGPGGPQTLTVNLGSVSTVNQVQLSWGAAYAKAYQIQVSSNDSSWTTIYSTTTGQGGVQLLTGLSGSGQYVRLDALQGVQARFSLDAFAVYPLTLTWAGGSAAWGPDNADWIGPGGKLQTWQNGSDVVFAGMPGVVSLFGQVSPHEIAFGRTTTTGGYLIQAGADPAGDQIVLPSNGAVINVGAASTSGGTAGGGSDTINALISAAASTSELTKTGGGLLVLGEAQLPWPDQRRGRERGACRHRGRGGATVGNADFASPALAAYTYAYTPAGTAPWTFTGGAAIATAYSAFMADAEPMPPVGNQVAVLQGIASISQVVNFPHGRHLYRQLPLGRADLWGRRQSVCLLG